VFGSGGGDAVAATLSSRFGYDVPVLGRIPIDIALREASDRGAPIVAVAPDSAAAQAFTAIAEKVAGVLAG
jgi:ATP-binding protein involved in chromosome partitioning